MHLLENTDKVGNIPCINIYIYMKCGLGLAGEDRPSASVTVLGMFLSFPWRCFISQHSPECLHFKTSSVICWAKQRIIFMHRFGKQEQVFLLFFFFSNKVEEKLHNGPP